MMDGSLPQPAAPTRPALRYLGGKWKLAPWIIAQFPPHRVYVEPFGGAASVLLRKPRALGECYNDMDGAVVNLFRVLRDPASAAELCRLVSLTPFARAEFDSAFEPTDDPVEAARRLVLRSHAGHGSSAALAVKSTGFRASMVNRGGNLPAGDWRNMPDALAAIHDRLQGVLIEQRPALQVMARYDHPDALVYLDPPYVPGTRSTKKRGESMFHAYAHELTDDDHVQLLDAILATEAMVVLSGYANDLYDDALKGWERLELATHADGALDRLEILWVSPAASAARGGLFAWPAGLTTGPAL